MGGRTPRWRGITLLHELRQVRVGGAAWQKRCSLRRGDLTPAALQLAPQLPPPSWPPSLFLPAGPLSQAGIPVAISSDNVRDQFYAYGDLDMLEVFTQASGGWQQSSRSASRASSAASRARLGRALKRLGCNCAACNSAVQLHTLRRGPAGQCTESCGHPAAAPLLPQSCRMAHLDRPYGDWPQSVTSIPGEAPS